VGEAVVWCAYVLPVLVAFLWPARTVPARPAPARRPVSA
jgi:hypothetical protein